MDIEITVSLYTTATAISTPTANFCYLLVLLAQVLETSVIFRKYKLTVIYLSEQNILMALADFWTSYLLNKHISETGSVSVFGEKEFGGTYSAGTIIKS
jgi:hypothetical protein